MNRAAARICLPDLAGQPLSGFDFSGYMRAVCTDVVGRVPKLSHIDLARVAIGYCQTRKPVRHGIQATLTPLRFERGELVTRRRRGLYTVQRVFAADGVELLYILNFYLPRFLNGPRREKLVTAVHELWHIGPAFDGDLRRHPGRCYAHSSSQKKYDEAVEQLVDCYLASGPSETLLAPLDLSFRALFAKHGNIYGLRIPAPKLLPVTEQAA